MINETMNTSQGLILVDSHLAPIIFVGIAGLIFGVIIIWNSIKAKMRSRDKTI